MDQPLFSLILATIQRTEELEWFLIKLKEQNYSNLELVIVDQNTDDRLLPIVEKFKDKIKINRVISKPGLCRARNAGLQYSTGEIIAFPDDDCWYPADLLSNLSQIFIQHPEWDGITGTVSNENNGKSIWKWDQVSGQVTKTNVWQRGISITVFLRRRVIDRVGSFDEELGLGAPTPWQSGEETDYLIRAVKEGLMIQYLPEVNVYHDDKLPTYTEQEIQKAYYYGYGMGYILHKHAYPFLYSFFKVLRPFLIAVRAYFIGPPKKALYFMAVARGRWRGLQGR